MPDGTNWNGRGDGDWQRGAITFLLNRQRRIDAALIRLVADRAKGVEAVELLSMVASMVAAGATQDELRAVLDGEPWPDRVALNRDEQAFAALAQESGGRWRDEGAKILRFNADGSIPDKA